MSFVKKSFADISAQMLADNRRLIPALTNAEGSVSRSLFESFAVELALLYEQLDLAYQAGFVDTAEGADLDRVVAVLGIKRNEPDYAVGSVIFTRDPGSNEELLIPIGTLVTTVERDGEDPSQKAYLTVETGWAAVGKNFVEVRVQADIPGPLLTSAPGTVVVMPRPAPGVKAVTNPHPIRFFGRDRETDEELRARAKQALLASGRASVTSIENALLGMPGISAVHVREDFAEPYPKRGAIEVFVDGLTTQNAPDVQRRIDEVRAAGIFVTIKPSTAIAFDAILQIEAAGHPTPEERIKLENRVRDAVVEFVDRLGMGKPLLFSHLTAAVLKVPAVSDLVRVEIETFYEAAFAVGKVLLRRPPAASALVIQPRTLLETTLGHEFLTRFQAVFNEVGQTGQQIEVPVAAVLAGREGEIYRTGTAVSWKPLTIEGTSIRIENPATICIERTRRDWTDRRIPVGVSERLISNNIRVASELNKPLKVRAQVRLLDAEPDPAAGDSVRRAIEEVVRAFFAELAGRAGRSFLKSELVDRIGNAVPPPGPFDLRLVSFPFQSKSPRDDFRIEATFIEKPELETIVVYSNALSLTGEMRLILSFAASPEQRSVAAGTVRQALEDYLDGIGSEDIDLSRFETIAAAVENVLRVDFRPDLCGIVDASGTAIEDRIRGSWLKVQPFEKVFLADAPGFSIET